MAVNARTYECEPMTSEHKESILLQNLLFALYACDCTHVGDAEGAHAQPAHAWQGAGERSDGFTTNPNAELPSA